jgi:predicted RNA-binding Zn-ribbon protein involved in translation (DUF1610 family)
MRHDSGLYLIAIICFVLAVFLFMGYTGYIQLTTGNEVTDLVVAMFSAVLGVVFVGMGYGVRPKEAVPVQPASPETSAKQKLSPLGMYTAECPKCGGEVANPRKSWKMAGRPDRTGKRTELTMGLFDCPKCNRSFRVVLGKRKI